MIAENDVNLIPVILLSNKWFTEHFEALLNIVVLCHIKHASSLLKTILQKGYQNPSAAMCPLTGLQEKCDCRRFDTLPSIIERIQHRFCSIYTSCHNVKAGDQCGNNGQRDCNAANPPPKAAARSAFISSPSQLAFINDVTFSFFWYQFFWRAMPALSLHQWAT